MALVVMPFSGRASARPLTATVTSAASKLTSERSVSRFIRPLWARSAAPCENAQGWPARSVILHALARPVSFKERPMKWVKLLVSIFGGLLALMGLFWILQGTGIVPVGGMANQIQFAYIGAVVVVVGGALIWLMNRRPRVTSGK